MRIFASSGMLDKLLAENPTTRYFCFTEDRMYDIRLRDAIPVRWAERPADSRTIFSGNCTPGEFYTFQIGLYAPYIDAIDIKMTFSDLVGTKNKKIKSSSLHCFNLGGIDADGKHFVKRVDVPKSTVQAFWIGIDVPSDCQGIFNGKVILTPQGLPSTEIFLTLHVEGNPVSNHGDDEGWRKSRLRWLDYIGGNSAEPTSPYIPVKVVKQTIHYLGGTVELSNTGFPKQITTRYDPSNQLSSSILNNILDGEMKFVIETASGVERLSPGNLQINFTATEADWIATQKNQHFEITCLGHIQFDGLLEYKLLVKSLSDIAITDIRLEVPYSSKASKYWMGLGNKGGLRKDSLFRWKWDVDHNHQDKLWIGDVNAGLNLMFKDENYTPALINIYYSFGKLKEPVSWGNKGKGGIDIIPGADKSALVKVYSGERHLKKGDVLHYHFNALITPVKPVDIKPIVQERFFHSGVIEPALIKEKGVNNINIHHGTSLIPFINYPYHDEVIADLKKYIKQAHDLDIKVRPYYTTRYLTVNSHEFWALRSLGSEVIHDGPGKDTHTLIDPDGPHEWLNKNVATHFIVGWTTPLGGKYSGQVDLSVVTTPATRWDNFYLAGLEWMVKNIGIDGVYIDDSALNNKAMQRARRILDADGKRRLVDLHSWNHMNLWAGYANSLHLYLEYLPYIDRLWLGEDFFDNNTLDFWMVEMSGIPFGLMSEMLHASNFFRGMVFGMQPHRDDRCLLSLWKIWDEFGMKDARMFGYWDSRCPVKTGNDNLPATVFVNGDKALVVIANWSDLPQNGELMVDENLLGFTPSKASLPQIDYTQWGDRFNLEQKYEILGRNGLLIMLEYLPSTLMK